jgi:uncharacterized repeat protein (TIGR03806 family)
MNMGVKVSGFQGFRIWRVAVVLGGVLVMGARFHPTPDPSPDVSGVGLKPKLSDYAFFSGALADLSPAPHVFPYEVNAPLFSDYAEKARFIYLPEGTTMTYRDSTAFDFPNGAVIIKNFYYPHDAAKPEQGRRILETRLLLKEEKGWKALEYIWNDEQTDALLEVAGGTFPVSWLDVGGKKQHIQYVAPNLNQCKGCHSYDGKFVPIGITTRQLNRIEGTENQLIAWQKVKRLNLPENFNPETAPRLTDYRISNPESQIPNPHESAARAYLDANCGHCHNAHGPASTSGMMLDIFENNPERLGVHKTPVAAGRGSGDRKFGIVPGKPGESILVFRMESDDTGIRMPELGRQLAHKEGLDIIKAWIKDMK